MAVLATMDRQDSPAAGQDRADLAVVAISKRGNSGRFWRHNRETAGSVDDRGQDAAVIGVRSDDDLAERGPNGNKSRSSGKSARWSCPHSAAAAGTALRRRARRYGAGHGVTAQGTALRRRSRRYGAGHGVTAQGAVVT